MNILSRIFRSSEPEIAAGVEAELDAFSRGLWNPFPDDWPISERKNALPAYVERQESLAGELSAELALTGLDCAALDAAWAHFLATRKLVKTHCREPRHLRGDRTMFELTHRDDLASLQVLERVGALFGVVLQRMVASLSWEIGHDPTSNYIHEGEPVLRGFPGDFPEMNPTQVVLTLSRRAIASPVRPLGEIALQWARGTSIPGLGENAE